MKTVGIISFHNADNYGAVLQNYALQHAIITIGVQPITIDYQSEEIKKGYRLWKKTKSMKGNINNILFFPFRAKRKVAFFHFRKTNLHVSKAIHNSSIQDCRDSYDYYICGSDQIWNASIVGNDYDAYSLEFVKTRPKFSYAASAGTVEIKHDGILRNVRQLNLVTVREKGLQQFLSQQGINSKVVCDPVFLLSKDDWKQIMLANKKKNYLFVYYIGERGGIAKQIADYISETNGLDICCPCNSGKSSFQYKYNTYTQGPDQFITDIANADFVVASSFHATAFAIIFEREFVVVPHTVTSQRVVDLLKELDLMDRIVYSLEDYMSKKLQPINYDSLQDKLHEWRKSAIQTLIEMRDWDSVNEK